MAVDDAGAGYAGLQQLIGIRPCFIKLDRALVEGIDRDEAKLVLAEALGAFASRIDAWVIAEGVGTNAELDALIRLQVPLGQGYRLCRPEPPWAVADEGLAARMRTRAKRTATAHLTIAPLLEDVPTSPEARAWADIVHEYSLHPDLDIVVVLAPTGSPQGFVTRVLAERGLSGPRAGLRVKPTSRADEVARRATTRLPEERFDPILCIDDAGRHLGIVRFERLVGALAGEGSSAG